MKKLQIIILAVLLLFFGAAAYFWIDIFVIYAGKPAGTDSTEKIISIYRGQKFEDTAERLNEAGIIENPFKFMLFARLKGFDKKIKAGEYSLSAVMPPDKILDIIVSGKIYRHRITIPEGYTIYQIAAVIAAEELADEADFLKAATDPAFVHQNGFDAATFEGYLFPDTYYFAKGLTPKQIISSMVKRFKDVFTSEWKEKAKSLGFSVHQVVTLASIIEKETGEPSERPVISSVFHNRLKKNMRLETDPTVIYGIKDFDGNLTRKHLNTLTPYNTYQINGLPPGPIASPGLKSLEAALYPDDTPFLYFVAKGDKTHQFSTNLKDHNQAVRKYQLKK